MTDPEKFFLFLVLAVCFYTDVKSRLIYNRVIFPAFALETLIRLSQGISSLAMGATGFFLLFLLHLPLYLMDQMGAGDVKLAGLIGWFIGGKLIGPYLFWYFILLSMGGILLYGKRKAVPLAPFMFLAFWGII